MAEPPIAAHLARPSRAHTATAIALTGVIAAIGLVAIPYGAMPLETYAGFLPAFGSLTFIGDLITALLLFSQGRALGDRALAQLGGAYLFSCLIIIPHMLAFPGVFAAAPVIGRSASAVWLWAAWHGGFALGVANFARSPGGSPGAVHLWRIVLGVSGLVLALALIATIGEPWLPVILVDGSYARLTTLGIGPAVLACNLAALALIGWRLRRPSILTVWLAVAMAACTTDVCLTLLGSGRFTLGWYLARVLSLVCGITVLAALLMDSVRLFNSVARANLRLEKLSLTDPLTEIANRRAFEQRLDTEWRRATREQSPLSLVMIDIDHFKRFNDRFGHPAGDECLRQVAQFLAEGARRPWDMAARMGGEEFAVLLPQTEAEGAATVAEMFRGFIEQADLPHPDSPFERVTISLGVASVYPYAAGETQQALMDAADAALYRAKNDGRNRVRQHVAPVMRPAVEVIALRVAKRLSH